MNKKAPMICRPFILCLLAVITLCSCRAFAGDLALTLEYYQTDNIDRIDSIYIMKMTIDEERQKLYDDLINADESSRRTLNSIIDILDWYQVSQLRKTLSLREKVFSEDIIVPENLPSSRSISLPEGVLDLNMNIQKKRNHHVPMGMQVVYDDRLIFSDTPRVYPMDKFILLTNLERSVFDSRALDLLFLKIAQHKTEDVQE